MNTRLTYWKQRFLHYIRRFSGKTGRSFVLYIGDEGAILIQMEGKNLIQRVFVPSATSPDIARFTELLQADPSVNISILVDLLDQAYNQQTLPGVSSLSIGKLVERRLARHFTDKDIYGAIGRGREEGGRHDWKYIFVSTPAATGPLGQWLKYLDTIPNVISGIHLVPLETEPLLADLIPLIAANKQEIEQHPWQMCIFHTKTGGFRQIIAKQQKLQFTRLIQQSGMDNEPKVIAGILEQETQNSIEYLKRMISEEAIRTNIIIVTASDVREHFDSKKFANCTIHLLTPHEVATHLGIADAVGQQDRFADILLTSYFTDRRKPVLRLHTSHTRKIYTIRKTHQITHQAALATLALGVLYNAYLGMGYAFKHHESSKLITEKNSLMQQLATSEKQILGKYDGIKDMQELESIHEMARLYNLLSGNNQQAQAMGPFTMLASFNTVRNEAVLVKGIRWTLVPKNQNNAGDISAPLEVQFGLDIEFYSGSGNFEKLFDMFDSFIANLQKTFTGFRVEYTRLPEKLAFNNANKAIPIQLMISGPKS